MFTVSKKDIQQAVLKGGLIGFGVSVKVYYSVLTLAFYLTSPYWKNPV